MIKKHMRISGYITHLWFAGCMFFLIPVSLRADTTRLTSPDALLRANIVVSADNANFLQYTIDSKKEQVIALSGIGMQIEGIEEKNFECKVLRSKITSGSWKPVYGEKAIIPDKYNEIRFHFRGKTNASFLVIVTCRMYNEGFSFRYKIIHSNNEIVVSKETSTFQFSPNALAWVSSTAQGVITRKKVNDIGDNAERPLTLKLKDNLFVSIGEAGLVDFARMKFSSAGSNSIMSKLFENVVGRDSIQSPWRFILIGNSPGDLLGKNHLLLNLNEPSQIGNTAWIVPGKALRETTLTTAGALRSIDFASAHHIGYILFDAGWYGREDHDSSNATRVALDPLRSKGPLDLHQVIAYGKKKNVGVILYVNRRALERQIDTLLPLYQSWGVKGLKFGFVQVGSQRWTNWLHEAVRKAAKYNMIVDIHDEYRPTGYSRTYPNLLTQEGIRGDEETVVVEHTITTLFTRMLAGPADNTFCYFTNRVNKMGTHAAQMAKAVCIYSPLQFLYWYDRPDPGDVPENAEAVISDVPELSWFDNLPVSWDTTTVLEADMEAYATIARKHKDEWWLGSLNGTSARKITIPCKFLGKGQYNAVIYTEDPSMNSRTNVRIYNMKVNKESVLSFDLTARNGLGIRFIPLK